MVVWLFVQIVTEKGSHLDIRLPALTSSLGPRAAPRVLRHKKLLGRGSSGSSGSQASPPAGTTTATTTATGRASGRASGKANRNGQHCG